MLKKKRSSLSGIAKIADQAEHDANVWQLFIDMLSIVYNVLKDL